MSKKLTEDIIRVKLRDWTLTSHLEKVFNNGQANEELKKQIEFFVVCGLVEKSGERRGVKYRYKQDASIIQDVAKLRSSTTGDSTSSDVEEEVEEDTKSYNAVQELKEYQREKEASKSSAASLLKKDVTVSNILTWLLEQSISDTSSISSYTVSFKKCRDNKYIVRAYSGLMVVKEEVLSPTKFKALLSILDDTSEKGTLIA